MRAQERPSDTGVDSDCEFDVITSLWLSLSDEGWPCCYVHFREKADMTIYDDRLTDKEEGRKSGGIAD